MINLFILNGIRFTYSVHSAVPEIPRIQDVLYVLRIEDTQEYYDFCAANHEVYVENCHLVAAAVGHGVLNAGDRDLAVRLIARAIVRLSPNRVRETSNQAYEQAVHASGMDSKELASLSS